MATTQKAKPRRRPTTQKAKPRRRATPAARAQAEDSIQRLQRVTKALESAQKDVGSIGGSVGTGVRDLRGDVTKLLRDARRDLAKMRRAIERDLNRLQKDLTEASSAKPVGRHPAASTRRRRAAH
jgi:hypothetical protein